jgi:hypothetical protein
MSLKHVDLESALRRLADRRIEEAMREGKFDNLAGAGKPLDLEPMPADENARVTWWMLRILKGADFTPDEIRMRRQIESLKGELASATTPARVAALVKLVNGLVHQLNTLGTNAIHIAVAPVSLEVELERLRERNPAKPQAASSAARPTVAPPNTAPLPASPAVAPPPRQSPGDAWRECVNKHCRCRNTADARFCRRCGKVLA